MVEEFLQLYKAAPPASPSSGLPPLHGRGRGWSRETPWAVAQLMGGSDKPSRGRGRSCPGEAQRNNHPWVSPSSHAPP